MSDVIWFMNFFEVLVVDCQFRICEKRKNLVNFIFYTGFADRRPSARAIIMPRLDAKWSDEEVSDVFNDDGESELSISSLDHGWFPYIVLVWKVLDAAIASELHPDTMGDLEMRELPDFIHVEVYFEIRNHILGLWHKNPITALSFRDIEDSLQVIFLEMMTLCQCEERMSDDRREKRRKQKKNQFLCEWCETTWMKFRTSNVDRY